MKAQSELAGDRKRRAETTRPRREAEQQNWIDGTNIPNMNQQLELVNTALAEYQAHLDDLGVSEAQVAALNATGVYQFANEVVYSPRRPAMDGVYSVNSVKICRLP